MCRRGDGTRSRSYRCWALLPRPSFASLMPWQLPVCQLAAAQNAVPRRDRRRRRRGAPISRMRKGWAHERASVMTYAAATIPRAGIIGKTRIQKLHVATLFAAQARPHTIPLNSQSAAPLAAFSPVISGHGIATPPMRLRQRQQPQPAEPQRLLPSPPKGNSHETKTHFSPDAGAVFRAPARYRVKNVQDRKTDGEVTASKSSLHN